MEPSLTPRPTTATVLVVSTAFEAVERIRKALGARYVLVRCSSVKAAQEEIARWREDSVPVAGGSPSGDEAPSGRPVSNVRRLAGLVLEPVDALGEPTAPLVQLVRASARATHAETPRVSDHAVNCRSSEARDSAPALVVLVRRTTTWSRASVALLEERPTMVAVVEDLDLTSVLRVLTDRLDAAEFVATVWGELEFEVPPALRPLLRFALMRASGPLSVSGLAGAMGLHRKTLWSQCRREGVENVQELVTWCRLLAAEHVLRSCTRPVDAVAEELAFASPTALRNAIRRHVGTSATALRAPGAPRAVSEGFRSWMRGQRRSASEVGAAADAASPHVMEGDTW